MSPSIPRKHSTPPIDPPARRKGADRSGPTADELEEQLKHVQRLVVQGELAATAVHEISNLLTLVMFNAGLLRLRHKEEPEVMKYVDPILHASNVIGSLCTQLRNLSRPAPAQLRVVDLADATRRTFALLDQIIVRNLALETGGDAPLLITADPAHIDQILVNLVLNARDATPEPDGQIFVRVGHTPATAQSPALRYLEVADNGIGMSPQVKRQVFTAFFTTKPVGQGTGLGLATVRRLVRGMGGSIKLTTKPGQGTAIRVLFPLPNAADEAQFQTDTLAIFAEDSPAL